MKIPTVLNEQCATCIFRPGNPMMLSPGRVKGMVESVIREGKHIPCHETMTYDDDDESSADGPLCRGFYDRYGQYSTAVQIAERLGVLTFVDAPPL